MGDTDLAARERILAAAILLLKAGAEPERLTVRRLAEEAGVAVGAINYYFQNKGNLLNLAVGQIMSETAALWYQPARGADADPVTRLRNLIKETGRIAMQYRRLSTVAATYELLNGDFNVPVLVQPLLREIFGTEKTELEVRLLAFQLIVATQVALLRAEAFQKYAGVNLVDEAEREKMIDLLVDHLVRS